MTKAMKTVRMWAIAQGTDGALAAPYGVLSIFQIRREALAVLFYSIADDARARSEVCWKKNKPPMAAYWRVSSVWARHIARALRRANRTQLKEAA